MKLEKFDTFKRAIEPDADIPTFREMMESFLIGKKVRIGVGHKDNNQWITGEVTGFSEGTYENLHILLKSTNGNTEHLEAACKDGRFDEHYLRLDDRIEIIG